MTAQIIYPLEGKCPFCKTELKLSEAERNSQLPVFCPKCGAQYPVEKVDFTPVQESASTSVPTQPSITTPTTTQNQKELPILVLFIACGIAFVIPIIGGIFFFILLADKYKSDHSIAVLAMTILGFLFWGCASSSYYW